MKVPDPPGSGKGAANGKGVIVRRGLKEAGTGWYYNLSDRTIWVKYEIPEKKSYDVIVSTEKFDLIGMVEE